MVGMDLMMSTTDHPQTDGQAERSKSDDSSDSASICQPSRIVLGAAFGNGGIHNQLGSLPLYRKSPI